MMTVSVTVNEVPAVKSASMPADGTCVTVGVYCVAGTLPPLVAARTVDPTLTGLVVRVKCTDALLAYGIGVLVGTGVYVGWPGGAVGCGVAVGTLVGRGVWPGFSVAVGVGLSVATATGPVLGVDVVPPPSWVKTHSAPEKTAVSKSNTAMIPTALFLRPCGDVAPRRGGGGGAYPGDGAPYGVPEPP